VNFLSLSDQIPENLRKDYRDAARQSAIQNLACRHGLFRFCTEDIACYLDALAPSGRRCLTVASSGDQTVNLLMAGASEVVAFDTDRDALSGTAFKLAALQEAEDGDPRSFRNDFDSWLRPDAFRKVAKRMGFAEKDFFESRGSLSENPADAIFKPWRITGLNPYVSSPEAFAAARSAVTSAAAEGRVSVVQSDVRSLHRIPGIGTFDVIVLSNIVSDLVAETGIGLFTLGSRQYGRSLMNVADLAAYVKSLTWPAASMLRPGGAMLADYVYSVPYLHEGVDADERETNGLRNAETRRAAFEPPPGFSVEEIRTDSRNSESGGDDVAVIFRRNAE
jgi:hypothetical protein